MRQFLKKVIGFLGFSYLSYLGLTIILILVFSSNKSNFHPDRGNFHREYEKAFSTKDVSILILGSSRILAAVEPSIIQENVQLKTAQLGFKQSNLSYTYDLLLAYLKGAEQLPEHIILDISWFSFDSRRLSYKPYASYFAYQNPLLFKRYLITNEQNHLKNGLLTLGRTIARRNQSTLEFDMGKKERAKQDSLSKSYLFESNDLGFLKTFPEGNSEVVEEQLDAFKAIVALCEEKGINLILLTTPEDEIFSKSQQNREEIYSLIRQNAISVTWLDYSLGGKNYKKTYENLLLDSHHIYFKQTFTRILLQDLEPYLSQ